MERSVTHGFGLGIHGRIAAWFARQTGLFRFRTGSGRNFQHLSYDSHAGRAADFDFWAYNGCAGWAFEDVLPYFQKLENQEDDTNPTGGKGGPVNVKHAKDTGNAVSQTWIDACIERGYPYVEDFNREDAEHNGFGAGWHHIDVKDGKRCGARVAYLEPALSRPNVTAYTHCLATRLVFDGKRCVGVEYLQDGETKIVLAEREVIVSAGAIQTPKLLMLSGIGGAEQLEQHGIPVLVDLPGVGENFHDHPLVIGPFGLMDKPGPEPRGNMTETALFWGSKPGLPTPDLEICLVHKAPFGEAFFANVIERVQTGQPVSPAPQLVNPRVILSIPGLVRPMSRGSVRLSDADPTTYPQVDANYFSEKVDLDRTVQMVQMAREIYDTQVFKDEWGLIEIGPGPDVTSREQLEDWVINNVGSYYHFVGTCKMGVDSMAVVDPSLKVRGVEGLRVADGSIMPAITSANPHTAILMIGEKAADLIKQDQV